MSKGPGSYPGVQDLKRVIHSLGCWVTTPSLLTLPLIIVLC